MSISIVLKSTLIGSLLFYASLNAKAQQLSIPKMEKILKKESTIVASNQNCLQINYKGLHVMIVADRKTNQIQIISPAKFETGLSKDDYKKILEANHKTTDEAKYTLNDGFIWSSLTCSLHDLKKRDLLSAVQKVYSLVLTYPTTVAAN